MNDFEGLLSTDYGFKPQGKSAPMAPPPKSNLNPNPNSNPLFNFDIGPSPQSMSPSSSPFFDRHDDVFKPNRKPPVDDFSDLGFGGDVFSASNLKSGGGNSSSPVNLDSIFGGGGESGARFSSLPVFDRPMYDEDVVASSAKYEDLFSSSSAKKVDSSTDVFDDLYGGLDKKETRSGDAGIPSFDDLLGGLNKKETRSAGSGIPAFDDLLPGFNGGGRGGTSSTNRAAPDAAKKPSPVVDDPFVVLESTSQPGNSSSGIYSDPLEEIGNLNSSGRSYVDNSSSGGLFDDVDPLDGFGKGVPVFVEEKTERETDESSIRTSPRSFGRPSSASGDKSRKSSVRSPERATEKKIYVDDYQEPPDSIFDMPSYATDSHKSVPNATSTAHSNAGFRDSSSRDPASPTADENIGSSGDIWLTVSEIPLFTQPTAAPPPSRPPPPRPARFSRAESGSYAQKKTGNDSSFTGSPFDELDDFSVGTNRSNAEGGDDGYAGEDFDTNSVAAAAMKEAVDRAEAKFRHARGVRERENAKASKDREALQVEKEEKASQEAQERAFREHQDRVEREKQQREREEGERRRDEEERRRIEKENEEKERDKRRIERERELARQAVERASREARERAAIEARVKSERAAVQRAQAEARERAGKAAVQRVQTEARERAAADAKERAEKSAAEARERARAEKSAAEAKERARAEKIAAEAKERARAEVREREAREKAAAAASRANQSKNEEDLESFFGMGSRASSAPKHRTGSSDPFETQFPSKPAPQATGTSVNSSSMRKASSSTNIVDDLSSIFGAPPSAGDFQNVEGETIERRRARLKRYQKTQERAANALANKNARDLEAQREQQERHRFSDSLDVEIKRWSAGKEGNLRALLSTLQYVLWPECGWQPVSLTDLIVGASVKKAYRMAMLCIHPDKVQQKGATLQQKYVSEKVFDLLKEAWNKFNSEELF